MKKLSVFLFLISISLMAVSQITDVNDIKRNKTKFNMNFVYVQGVITQYVDEGSIKEDIYILKDSKGGVINIKTEAGNLPNINEKYQVKGLVKFENNEVFLEEQSKQTLEVKEPPVIEPPHPIDEEEKQESFIEKYGLHILLIILLLAIVLFGSLVMNKLQQQPKPHSDIQTIKVPPRSRNTVKMNKARFVILNGVDAGKFFYLFGIKTGEGIIMSFGRNAADWIKKIPRGREKSHVLINDNTGTLSRLQAEVIFKQGKVYLKNKADVNKTEVNDNELRQNQEVELSNRDIITTGDIQFQFLMQL